MPRTIILFILVCIPWTGVLAADRLEEWEVGQKLLDAGQAQAAASHYYSCLQKDSTRLEILEGCWHAERRIAHFDSIALNVAGGASPAPGMEPLAGSPAGRFITAASLMQQNQYQAAADSFQSLGNFCQQEGDSLSALFCLIRKTRCHFELGGRQPIQSSQNQILSQMGSYSHQVRLNADLQLLVANLHFKKDDLDEAQEIYLQVLQVAQEHNFHTQSCDLFNALGGVMSKRRQLGLAFDYYQQAVAKARQLDDSWRLVLLLANLGYQETNLRHLDTASDHLNEALALANTRGYRRLLGAIQSGLGAVAEMSGQRQEAVARFEEAVSLSHEAGHHLAELGARQRLAYNLSMMGSYAQARRHFATCLEMIDQHGGQFILNWVLAGMALTNHKLGYLDEAAEYYGRAHAVNLEIGDKMSAAWCVNSQGIIHSLQGRYGQALKAHYQALEQYTALGDQEGEGEAHSSLANVYFLLGNYAQSLSHGQQALELAKESQGQELLRSASHGLALVYAATGQSELAEENLIRVVEIAHDWSDLVPEIWARIDLAEHYLEQGQPQKTRQYLDSAWQQMGDGSYSHIRSQASLLKGRIADSPVDAIEWSTTALHLAQAAGLLELEWQALSDLGWYHRQLGDSTQAGQFLEQALQVVESLRRLAGSDQLRQHMVGPVLEPYERLVLLHLEGENPAAAFAVTERFRAQILAHRLRQARSNPGASRSGMSELKERDITSRLNYLQGRLQENSLSSAVRDSLLGEIENAENDFTKLKLQWAGQDKAGVEFLYPEPPRTRDLQKTLAEDEHHLSYFLGHYQSYLFSLNRNQVRAYQLPVKAELEEKMALFLGLQKNVGRSQLPAKVLDNARVQLYEELLAPAQRDWQPGQTLVISPDGLINRLPLAYLHDGQEFLLKKHPLFSTPSLQVLAFLRDDKEREKQSAGPGVVVAIGCAGREPGASPRSHLFNESLIEALPNARQEAQEIGKIFADPVVLVGQQANEEYLESGVLHNAAIIHFAAHSYADEHDTRRSYIVLNRGNESTGVPAGQNDDLLQWGEILDLEMQAQLVTLASCRSAGGVLTYGEGISGLTQAFLHAGNSCVLAALTDVPDRETKSFMQTFYRDLEKGNTAAKALQTAQLAQLKDERAGGLPTRASSFVLMGDGQVRYAGHGQNPWTLGSLKTMILLLSGPVLVAAWLWRRKKLNVPSQK